MTSDTKVNTHVKQMKKCNNPSCSLCMLNTVILSYSQLLNCFSNLYVCFSVRLDNTNTYVYVVGSAAGTVGGQTYSGGLYDIMLAKFDSSGTRQWVRLIGTSGEDQGYGCKF